MTAIQIEHQAMNTRWRCWLKGTDNEQLADIGNLWADMLDRWDFLLSKFNPASEVTRLNRAAVGKPLKIPYDLSELLEFCERARATTKGIFDITATSAPHVPRTSETAPFQIDVNCRTFAWTTAARQIDFGGIAKGYVLDQLAPALRQYEVQAAMLDAGGSSLLSWHAADEKSSWQVSLAPADEVPSERLLWQGGHDRLSPQRPWLELCNAALSYSASRPAGANSGQTFDPRSGSPLPEKRACVVVTQSAAWAEVLSTTALCMGEAEAATYIKARGLAASRLGWLAGDDVHWYSSHD